MNDEQVEGTVILDGLLEGRVPSHPVSERRLREWVDFAASLGLHFNLQIEGRAFNLLADDRPVRVGGPGRAASEIIADALRELLKVFPPAERASLFSTLRSTEFRDGFKVQTVYGIGVDGSIQVQEESAPAKTKAAPRTASGRQKVRIAVTGVVVALALFAVSALFIDYRGLVSSLTDAVVPLDSADIEVEAGAFDAYFTVQDKKFARGRKALVLTLARTEGFPKDDAALDAAVAKAGKGVSARLALEALARGYVRCELFDADGEFLGQAMVRLRGLRESETAELRVPMPYRKRPARITIAY